MTSTAAERRVEVCPPASERPRYGLLAGLALGLAGLGFAALVGLLRLVGARAGGQR